ncbi:Phospholipase A2, major isoenzyme [Holothuria leucospilota]|uniref:Phospholipase A2 n=1 Tax=Holothuria leucospilota TaxID=206669 RepID=A0A9Q1C6I6_HOLLE|nr:Phospholipase A2, major isoenzyme [Holothuria leucospilota]
MRSALVFSLLFSLAFASSLRAKRSTLQFREMIHCLTDRRAYLDYDSYGCWCGLRGKGNPVDATDRCCKTHDGCYDDLKKSGVCRGWDFFLKGYSYSKRNCDTSTASVTCGGGNDCEVGLCRCDRAAAICFRRSAFNPMYRKWNLRKC